jgi:hypothetical protein
VRRAALVLALCVALPLAAQEAPKKKAKKQQATHKKPTPEQIRKFNELQKKQK